MRCPAKCRRVGMADDADSKSVGGNTVWVRVPPPAPRRNGLRSIQKAQPKGWAFLIPLRHSSFSPRNFACANFRGGPAALWAAMRGGVSLAATFLFHKKLIARSFRCGSFAPRNFASQISAGAPPPGGRPCGAAHPLRRFFCKSHRVLIPLLLLLPMKPCCAKFHGGPRRPGGAAKRKRRTACGGFLLCVPPAS